MGARIIEVDEVPEIVYRDGLYYVVEGGVEKRAYKPRALHKMVHRCVAAIEAARGSRSAEVVPHPRSRVKAD